MAMIDDAIPRQNGLQLHTDVHPPETPKVAPT